MSVRTHVVYPTLLAGFLAVMAWNHMLRFEHVFVAAIAVACFIPRAREFVELFMPVAFAGLLYDSSTTT